MVKEENVNYYNANKYVLTFLTEHAYPELLEKWKTKSNLHKFKNHMRPVKNNLPRRPMSEYIYFCREERPKIQEYMKKEKNTDVVNIHEVTCELGRRWQRFKEFPDPDLKQRLKELADIDSLRYHEEKVVATPQQNDKKHLRSKYLFFCREQRMSDPKISMKVLGQKWIEQKEDKALTRRYEKAKKQAEETAIVNTTAAAEAVAVAAEAITITQQPITENSKQIYPIKNDVVENKVVNNTNVVKTPTAQILYSQENVTDSEQSEDEDEVATPEA